MVSSTPRPHFTPGKDPVPILQDDGWAPGPVWTGGKSRPHRDSIPDRPARSQSLYRLSYPDLPSASVRFQYSERIFVFDIEALNFTHSITHRNTRDIRFSAMTHTEWVGT